MSSFQLLLLLALIAVAFGFVPTTIRPQLGLRTNIARSTSLQMSGNKAKFGIFSPAVYIAKFTLGEAKLNKVISPLFVIDYLTQIFVCHNRFEAKQSHYIVKQSLNGVYNMALIIFGLN